MKSARFNSLLASTALGLVLLLGTHAGNAQKALAQQSDNQITAAVPMPDTALLPPLTAKDIEPTAVPANETAKTEPVTAEPAKIESKQEAATPAAEPAKVEATKAASEPAATPVSATADSAVADQLRQMITGKQFDRIVNRKADREGVEAFYKARDYAPLWVSNGAADERAKAATAYLGQVDAVGLDPNDYPAPDFKSAATAEALAEDELKLTAAVLTYARQAQIGRIHFSRVSADIQFDLVAPEPAKVLAKLADGGDAGKVLDSYNPPQAEFKALREKLAELRQNGGMQAKTGDEKKTNLVKVPEGKILRPGMKDARVVALRKRLDVAGDKENPLYDDAVRDAVKTFQTQADLHVDGNLGANTVRAMNGEKKEARGPSADPIDTIIVNMERWRWLPRDLGNPHVIVNIPDYTLTLYNNDKVYWHTKIVVGKPGKSTPLISAEMKFITVNPTWNVPPSIIENEYLPALQQDPEALDRIGLKLTQDADGTIHIAQPPGAGNALGRIRFNFPNKFLVYQHDTPDKYLFAKDERAYSHGCMRVQNPLIYGEKLLSLVDPQAHYTAARLESMFGGNEININFPKNIWVHLTYQTAFVDDNGKLQLRKDIYGRDAKMIQILKSSERKVADIAIERAPNSSSKPVRMPVGMYGGSGGYSSGGNFFDFLFGGQRASPQPVYRPRGGQRVDNNGRYTYR
ncbi:MAG: L,D-transpeptidase family protein [Pseudolabrys sp.]